MNIELLNFENKRWGLSNQSTVFRHNAALKMIGTGSVLDLGCGDGLFLKKLKTKGNQARGLDASNIAIEKCLKSGLGAEVFDFTSNTLPFEDNLFDYVVLLDVLEHSYNPEYILSEAKRVSKEYVIVSVPNFNSLPARIHVLLGRVPENNNPKKGHIYWFNKTTLKQLFDRCTLSVVSSEVNTFCEGVVIFGTFIKLLAMLRPSVFGLSFIVKLKK